MKKTWTRWTLTSLLLLTVAACANHGPIKVKYNFPAVPERVKMESVVPDRNDRTGESGLWMNVDDGKKNLKNRERLYSIIEELRAFWRKTQ